VKTAPRSTGGKVIVHRYGPTLKDRTTAAGQQLVCVLKNTECWICLLDRRDGERISVGRRRIQRANGVRIVPGERVVEQQRQQIVVVLGLRATIDYG
jgi:hypothetical protein